MNGKNGQKGFSVAGFLFSDWLLVGCTSATRLMPTPNLYTGEKSYPDAEVQLAQKSFLVDMLYVTDRLPERL